MRIELIREVRRQFDQSALPIVMVTTQNETQDNEAAYAAGVNAILNKPFTADDLGRVLTKLGRLPESESPPFLKREVIDLVLVPGVKLFLSRADTAFILALTATHRRLIKFLPFIVDNFQQNPHSSFLDEQTQIRSL